MCDICNGDGNYFSQYMKLYRRKETVPFSNYNFEVEITKCPKYAECSQKVVDMKIQLEFNFCPNCGEKLG